MVNAMSEIQEQKKQLRKAILMQRKGLDAQTVEAASAQIAHAFFDTPVYKQATDVCLYVPIQNEVDLFRFADTMLKERKRIWLPRVKEERMDFYAYQMGTVLKEGAYHILEPDSDTKLIPEETDGDCLIVMPGAVFSKKRERIGYGGGYYDRYLEKHSGCKTVAVCYAFQIVEQIPTEKTDIKPQLLLWSKNI